MRQRGDTLTKYINAEETTYRTLQRTLKEAVEGGKDEYSEDGHDPGNLGHLSTHCTNAPNAKRAKSTDSGDVIFDMSPWANDFAEWRKAQSMKPQREPGLVSGSQHPNDVEDINGLEERTGCAILDSGATIMCSSTAVA